MGWKPEPVVRWQAERIEDPIARLRYLQAEMGDQPYAFPRTGRNRAWFALAVILAFPFFLPPPRVTSDIATASAPIQPFPGHERARPESFSDVWLVEENSEFETYSNGLRIDKTFSVSNQKRFYQVLDRNNGMQPLPEWRSEPVGIVYHTTESSLAPFDPDQNETLKHLSHSLVQHLRDNRSYNFVIDRFGRVFRVVEETSAANHSGNSVWADEQWAYINLNNSFLGIAFEAQTQSSDGLTPINKAQIHSGRILTEMLRARFKIAAKNCVTHAQVSVNPSNMRIGWHTDWASGFPFAEMGLANNYDLPLASLRDFGFEYDSLFRKAVGPRAWRGLALSEDQLARDAIQLRRSPDDYRSSLQDRYHRLYTAYKSTGALDEPGDTTNLNR